MPEISDYHLYEFIPIEIDENTPFLDILKAIDNAAATLFQERYIVSFSTVFGIVPKFEVPEGLVVGNQPDRLNPNGYQSNFGYVPILRTKTLQPGLYVLRTHWKLREGKSSNVGLFVGRTKYEDRNWDYEGMRKRTVADEFSLPDYRIETTGTLPKIIGRQNDA